MGSYPLAEAVKKRRLELGLTQAQLCEGICEPITISRLESGQQIPSRRRLSALLERLDLPQDRFDFYISEKEAAVEALQERIVAYNLRFEKALPESRQEIRREALALHEELEGLMEGGDVLSKQLLLRSRVILGKEDGPYSSEEKIQLLLEAMHFTKPGFDLEHIEQGLYTAEEVKIINNIAVCYSKSGKHLAAINLYRQLYRYMMEHRGTTTAARKHIGLVAFNYSRELDILGQYQEAVDIALEGRKICLQNGNNYALSGLLSVLAECYHFLGEDEKSKDFYFQSYYVSKAIGDEFNLANTREEARTYLGLQFPT